MRTDARRYPLSAGAGAGIWPCAFWPYQVDERVRIDQSGPANVLIINDLRDPATPYVGSKDLRAAFGGRARLVTVDQSGHGAYLLKPNECANSAGTAYLEDGRFPAHDLYCPATPTS
ncbi:hypothetical protein GCM10023195_70810 [Actinoallomurus liliacearum]|uniref:Peptidase S33 tripeptidyl aminopeptidase-like C-terminal domain-containing protein n=1 Tax=Actinoallomurus liliacearum TaxID=1080073 RepID=A0ABP8TX32_9ACTN